MLKSRVLAVYGVWQRNAEPNHAEDARRVKNTDNAAANRGESSQGEVRHLTAQHLIDLTHLLGALATQSREFH